MENDKKGLRRYSIRLPQGESTIFAEAITFALSEKGAWLRNLNGQGNNPYVPGLVQSDVRDLTAGEEPWGHDDDAAEGFEPETFSAVVAFVERGGKSGRARAVPRTAALWLEQQGWVVRAISVPNIRATDADRSLGPSMIRTTALSHPEVDRILCGLDEQDVDEVARLMGWQG